MSWICPVESCDDCPLFPCDVVKESEDESIDETTCLC